MAGKRKTITFEVDANECHNCTSHKPDSDGYPCLTHKGRKRHMHRVLYEEAFGELPEGQVARHTCDNRLCINLDHVVPGTPAQNTQDITDRGRHNPPVGIRSGSAKLTPILVNEIREATGSQYEIAARYGVNQSTVSRIKNKERWAECA